MSAAAEKPELCPNCGQEPTKIVIEHEAAHLEKGNLPDGLELCVVPQMTAYGPATMVVFHARD